MGSGRIIDGDAAERAAGEALGDALVAQHDAGADLCNRRLLSIITESGVPIFGSSGKGITELRLIFEDGHALVVKGEDLDLKVVKI